MISGSCYNQHIFSIYPLVFDESTGPFSKFGKLSFYFIGYHHALILFQFGKAARYI